MPKQLAAGREFPFIIIAPQCPPGQWWRPDEVIALLDHVLNWVNGDPDRIYLTGLSMGGTGTWLTAAEYPDRFAAIAPICGRSLPIRAPAVKNLPIWVFHGDAEPPVQNRSGSRSSREAPQRVGRCLRGRRSLRMVPAAPPEPLALRDIAFKPFEQVLAPAF
ncbi:MAG: hypothetical protein IPM18_13985 [Phycisphaerales bacterium]|nr:hypothetical protein [Phycisphaerales bacterium]